MVKLEAVVKEQSTKEIVDWEREGADEEGEKHHPEARRWARHQLVAGHQDLVAVTDVAIGPGGLEIALCHQARVPAGASGASLLLATGGGCARLASHCKAQGSRKRRRGFVLSEL